MSPKKSSLILNVEKFILDVEQRPAIWNRNHHCNKPFLEQMWEELSVIHKLPKVVLKAKWKGLRDNFRVEYKRIPRSEGTGEFLISPEIYESKWIHYYTLLFLTDHMRHRIPKGEHETYFLPQHNIQSQEYDEKNIVEPDLTNGLIRIPDSDEEFDEDDDMEDDDYGDGDNGNRIEEDNKHNVIGTRRPTGPEETKPKLLANYDLTKRRSVSPGHSAAAATVLTNSHSIKAESVSSSINDSLNLSLTNENFNFTKSSYSNGLIPSLKLKRQRLSEDSNFNGSSTMDNPPAAVADDDDYHYLLSLHPYMKQLNAAQKLRIRTKIQKLIFKELYKEDLEETK